MSTKPATVILLMPAGELRQGLVGVMAAAGHRVAAFGGPAELMQAPPEEACDLFVVLHTPAEPRGLADLAELRVEAPLIPALICGYDLDLASVLRAIRLGVVAVIDPSDRAGLLAEIATVRRHGAVGSLLKPENDRLAGLLVKTMEATERHRRKEASLGEAERRRLSDEIVRLQAYEQKLQAQERQLLERERCVGPVGAGGAGAAVEWEKLERAKMRLEAEQRNFLTEKIVQQEEMTYLKKRLAELTPIQGAYAELQTRLGQHEAELARRSAELDRREREILRREASLGLEAAPAGRSGVRTLLSLRRT